MDGRLPNSFRFGAPLSCHFKTKINSAENLFMSPLSKAKKSIVDIDMDKESVK